ncbi:Spx/MgsR family RNA polymerase-binding regulatory protein [Secundilactobacillus malefermentans]|uniref:Transcriptional regulator Spx n=2 Tax=Lactobacillaceae TaxID=33958 RepID=A0A4R5NEH3_9LACO|nr:Spx/MgsR family RNA polymerase-binding regulatory protein [Secundilactobacillus malefermentans]KRM58564.1 transcriptional regulator Spx [Secundilactobacillus malefermentans DSM 5705 = KCTC 3548]TDG72131.1 hypothetical protein C5L31_001605 [Secundilactobacillus malefermentans]
MLKFYYNANTPSKRKALKWLDDNEIQYETRNINFKPLDEEEITHIMHLSEEGTDQIISKRSKIMQNLHVALSKLSFNGVVKLIKENQGILKSPILMENDKLMSGFDSEQARMFIPPKKRRLEMRNLLSLLIKNDPLLN